MRCRQYDNVLTMVGELQQQVERLEGERNSKVETITELRQQQQQTEATYQQVQHALQQDVERLEGWRKMHFETIQELQQQVERLEAERNSNVETIQHQFQTTTELQQKVERLEGERNNWFQRQQQIIKSKEQEIHALKNELAAVHRLLNEGRGVWVAPSAGGGCEQRHVRF